MLTLFVDSALGRLTPSSGTAAAVASSRFLPVRVQFGTVGLFRTSGIAVTEGATTGRAVRLFLSDPPPIPLGERGRAHKYRTRGIFWLGRRRCRSPAASQQKIPRTSNRLEPPTTYGSRLNAILGLLALSFFPRSPPLCHKRTFLKQGNDRNIIGTWS